MAALIAHVALDLADRGQLPASSILLASTSASTSTKVGLPFVPRESIARDREAHAANTQLEAARAWPVAAGMRHRRGGVDVGSQLSLQYKN